MEKTTAPEPLTIVPTLYPEDPTAALIVRDYVLIDARSPEFGELNAKLDVIIDLLHQSNQISGEVRDQLIAHIQAGRTILASPKPDRNLIRVLLVHPLTYVASAAAGAIIGEYATDALHLLLRILETGIPV